MAKLAQKKFSINQEQISFLEHCKEHGFSDQSSLVREAIDHFAKDLKVKKRKDLMQMKAKELLANYSEENEVTVFTSLDGEGFI